MSVTIHSQIIDYDSLIPRIVDDESEGDETSSLGFKHSDIADENGTHHWPEDDCEFELSFTYLYSHGADLEAYEGIEGNNLTDTGVSHVLVSSETITLPRKSWKIPGREQHRYFINSQCTVTRLLIETIYLNLEDVKKKDLNLQFITTPRDFRYTIGGTRYASRLEGAAIVGPRAKYMPVISFTGVLVCGKSLNGFPVETFSAMLGQLAQNLRNLSAAFQDQDVFVVGFHGSYLHIARGLFSKDLITRVLAQERLAHEPVGLELTRGYNLCFKKDWLEATQALSRLLRYLLSGKSNVDSIQKFMA
ncbi:hypothetical protein BDV25DRAFT_126582 [Aspergillus avenaceus]|uniref:Uncharacterized protein n=1 Tax=Aspergillus avenaceus TaxID=36643 RepID=A0A5N6U6Q7_ASPAV|nr:hypothetical protein BDV25DRAFT_126582 [Aspergillus avenaceus]